MREIYTRKTKHGWVAYDRNGNEVTAVTKDLAIETYKSLYCPEKQIYSYEKQMNERVIP